MFTDNSVNSNDTFYLMMNSILMQITHALVEEEKGCFSAFLLCFLAV
jgi:hypothetical protein